MLLRILLLTHVFGLITSSTSSECIESAQYHTNLQPQGTQMVVPGAKVTFTCSANFPALYPLWEINSQTYRVTHLPPDYIATGSNLTIPIIMDTDVSCIFKKYLPEQGIVADICSNTATVKPFNIHGAEPTYCNPEEVIFYVGIGQVDIFMGDANPQTQCTISSTISSCNGFSVDEEYSPPKRRLVHKVSKDFFGKDANVTISKLNITCDYCDEEFYIPKIEHTVVAPVENNGSGLIARNLTNDYCSLNFNSELLTGIRLCIHNKSSDECFETCDKMVWLSWCEENIPEADVDVDLVGSAVENGTIISIYCIIENVGCTNSFSNVMIFNYEIIRCDDGYIVDGMQCKKVPQPPDPECQSPICHPATAVGAGAGVAGFIIGVIVSGIVGYCGYTLSKHRHSGEYNVEKQERKKEAAESEAINRP